MLALMLRAGTAGAGRTATPVHTHKQLFVDGAWIEASENVVLTMNPPHQTGERMVVADQPWEKGAKISCYNSVLKEDGPDGPRIRLWYDVLLDKPAWYPGDRRAVAYAESRDGIHFRKPILGLVAKDGSTQNNLVMPTDLERLALAGGSVMRDENPKCPPGERYKSWAKLYAKRRPGPPTQGGGGFPVEEKGGDRLWYSPDGLRWTLYPPPTGLRGSDTRPSWFWDKRIGRYLGYSREWVELTPGRTAHMVGYNESDDMLHWDSFALAIGADGGAGPSARLGSRFRPGNHGAGSVANRRSAGRNPRGRPRLLRRFHGRLRYRRVQVRGSGGCLLLAGPGVLSLAAARREPVARHLDVQLAVSRDGRRFQRLGGRRPFIRLGPEGAAPRSGSGPSRSRCAWVTSSDLLPATGPFPACRPGGAGAPGWHLTGDPPAGWFRVGGRASRRGLADHPAPGLRRRADGGEP